jgi:hypothetical protein
VAERGRWAITPRRVLVAFVTLLVLGLIISPTAVPGSGGLLTTYASDPGGARGLFETTRRLGWPASRLLDRFAGRLDSNAVYAVLRPPVELTSSEVSALLDAVRRGAGLLLVPGFGSAFLDSLGLMLGAAPPLGLTRADEAAWDSLGGLAPTPRWPALVFRESEEAPPDSMVVLLAVRSRVYPDSIYPVVVGLPLGRGRVVMMSHGALLSNLLLREADNAVLPVRMLEWVTPGHRAPLIFAEYHQGHGRHADVTGAIRRELFFTPVGRSVVHLLIAAGLLLLAVGVRPIAPRPRVSSERRSPLEHVGALAQAYAQVNATRTALRRLLRGLRRRHPIGTLRSASDDEYLSSLAARHPSVAGDVDVLLQLTHDTPAPDRFEAAGAAIAHIERTLST